MAGISGTLTGVALRKLRAPADGVNARIGAIQHSDSSLSAPGIRSIAVLHAGVDIIEKSGQAHYPALLIYCDKLSNSLKEKFRRFSGKAHLTIEMRHSEDRIEALDSGTQVYVDAVCALLDDSRGDWGGGAFYAGGYDVTYEPIARGGKNFLQRAKVGFDVEISR
ncbi:MAG: hypothetical protein ABUS51_02595 [Acidobacteriota bacterium]